MSKSRQQQTTKKKSKNKNLTSVIKDLNKETKNIRKTKRALSVVDDKEKKEELKSYLTTVKEKIEMILKEMTEEKIRDAGLAQLAKAFRSLANEMTHAQKGQAKQIERKSLNININTKDMTTDELLKFLSKKSQESE